MIGRTLWWGYLASEVLNVKADEKRIGETIDNRTIIYELHKKTGIAVCTGNLTGLRRLAIASKSDLCTRMKMIIGAFLVSNGILGCLSYKYGPLNQNFQLKQQNKR